MREHRVTFPELAALAVTRGMLGFGAGLLLSERFAHTSRRRTIGATLLMVGALSTIPIAIDLFRKRRAAPVNGVATGAPKEPYPFAH